MLTPELKKAVEQAGDLPVTLVDPETQRTYVLVPLDEYEKLAGAGYDDSPWTDEESKGNWQGKLVSVHFSIAEKLI